MKIAVFGGTGFIGKELRKILEANGHEVLLLDTRKDSGWASQLKALDVVVNLAGHPLFKDRWNNKIKALIYDSRIEGTKKIVNALEGSSVHTFISSSAIGIYGASEREADEKSSLADDFLARVCKDWEDAALVAQRRFKVRTVLLRTGIVLGKNGGALDQLLLPFKLGVGGPIGNGSQSMSWIHIQDLAGIILHCIQNDKISGAINGTAPNIVSNKEFSKTLGKVLNRPAVLPLPAFALHVVVGEAASVIASGQRAHPKAALESGYTYKFPYLEAALREILK